jgi:hypothetical protein
MRLNGSMPSRASLSPRLRSGQAGERDEPPLAGALR